MTNFELSKREIDRLLMGEASRKIAFCTTCRHAPLHHVPGMGCIVCWWLCSKPEVIVPNKPTEICRVEFQFELTPREREQAVKANPETYDQEEICGRCGMYWMQHFGYMCADGNSTFVKMFPKGKDA